jgi:hypothetical protein
VIPPSSAAAAARSDMESTVSAASVCRLNAEGGGPVAEGFRRG